jgi:fructan beta-fructosidase
LLLQTDLERTTAGLFGITLSNPAGDRLIIGLDRENGQVWVDRRNSGPKGFSETFFTGPHTAPLDFGGSTLDLRLLLDVASLELFAGQGKLNFTEVFFPETPFQTLTFWAQDGEWVLSDSRVYSLGGIWEGAR